VDGGVNSHATTYTGSIKARMDDSLWARQTKERECTTRQL
jgi:hypothetical protein